MGRWILLILVFSVGLVNSKTILAQTPSSSSAPRLVVSVFQQLDVTKKLPPLLQLINNAYQTRTGEQALSVDQVRQGFGGHFGPKVLRGCRAKVSCLTKKMKAPFPKASLGIFLGVGGLGDSILLKIILADLKTGKTLKEVRQSFNNLKDAKAKLPSIMAKLFPNYGSVRWTGLPKDATATLNGRSTKLTTATLPLAANKAASITVKAKGYKPKTFSATVKPNEQKTFPAAMTKTKPPPSRLVRRPPPPRREPGGKAQPVTQKWWFWTIIGVAAVGTGVGVAVGVMSQPSRKEGDYIPAEVPAPK